MKLHCRCRMFMLIAGLVLVTMPGLALAALVDAIEYYHASLDHYFVTADANEINKLDTGFFTGWQRTGQTFKVADPSTPLAGGTPVCRFYGNPLFGLDSHFYSASPAECAAVQQKFPDAWLLESSNVFQVMLPNTTTGACPAGSVPIYRAWNNRVDSNHRYTTSLATLQSMVAKGYVAEGYGSAAAPVAMCSPTGAAPGPVAQCSLSANDTSPFVGATIALSATCSGSPTSYAWSAAGCGSSSASCLVTSNTAGLVTYSVTATNANGNSAPATIDIVWRTPLPPPTCTLSATSASDPPVIGSTVLLTANCTNNPASFSWTGCNSNSTTCYVTETSSGPHTYTVTASSPGGSGTTSLQIIWSTTAPVPQDFCGNFPSVLRSTVPYGFGRTISANYPDPGFQWNGVWVLRLAVPAGTPASSVAGRFFVAEFGGGPVFRDVTISRFACDFRGVDASGANGPLVEVGGVSASGFFSVSTPLGGATLQPGQTYYINVRNRAPDGSISCPTGQRCDAFLDLTPPR